MRLVFLLIFWGMQIVCHVLLKYGSTSPGRWLPCFVIGNAVGVSSTWFLMLLYTRMNPNIALGLGLGGGFLFAQLALALLFHSRLSGVQFAGIVAIAAGMAMLAAGPKPIGA